MLRLAPFRDHCLPVALLLLLPGCSRAPDPELTPAAFDYTGAPTSADCRAVAAAEPASEQQTAGGVRFLVRAPSNYRADVAHPLLVVFAPAGHGPEANERFTRLTQEATSRGWLVAYAGTKPMALPVMKAMADVPAAVQARWCVDGTRLYATGHSDGGTVATALAVLPELPHVFAAIAPSAAGFRGEDLRAYGCPAPTPVFILHNHEDDHFPGYGREAARWWAACNRCEATPRPGPEACEEYIGCATGSAVRYCEPQGNHRRWPARQRGIVDFLAGWHRPP